MPETLTIDEVRARLVYDTLKTNGKSMKIPELHKKLPTPLKETISWNTLLKILKPLKDQKIVGYHSRTGYIGDTRVWLLP